ncbi:MAG TPA: hypothetical protein VMT00_14185 [Thermoanaerobaculia bacterium]|nr:hypothetical protein [Thermoanaerobaculia bacterium]
MSKPDEDAAESRRDPIGFSGQIAEALGQRGAWPVLQRLIQAQQESPNDLRLLGYIEIVRNVIVRDFLAAASGADRIPKLTSEFLTDYARFNLSAQEGYLVSLIDGRLPLQQLLLLSPFDTFTTLFCLARLRNQRAIMI